MVVGPVPHGLRGVLRTIDGVSFQAYRRILGVHELGEFRLTVLSVPPDALAGPAHLRLSIDRTRAGAEAAWTRTPDGCLILEDAIIRAATRAIEDLAGLSAAAAPGSGRIWVQPAGPGIVERTTAHVGATSLDLALWIDLPAIDRRVLGEQAAAILCDRLPRIGMGALLFPLRRLNDLEPRVAALTRRREAAEALAERGLAALIPSMAIPGRSIPSELRVEIETSRGPVVGLGIPRGITLVVGASVAGPGSWVRALEEDAGTAPGGTAIFGGPVALLRASRRSFGPIDLSAFVHACPEVPQPGEIVSDNAPAPLAVAASLVEAVEGGARVLLVDEDLLPAGALGRDGRMQRLVADAPGPLVPLIDRLVDLRDRWGLSIVIAARALGDLCEVADNVIVVKDNRVEDGTPASRIVVRATPGFRAPCVVPVSSQPKARSMRVKLEGDAGAVKVGVWGGRGVRVGEDLIDLSDTTLVRDPGRLRAIALLLKRASSIASTWRAVDDVLDELEAASAGEALGALEDASLCDLARPARLEIADALVRWKRVTFRVAPVTLRPPAR